MSAGRPRIVAPTQRSPQLEYYYKNRDARLRAAKDYVSRTREDFTAYVMFRMAQVKGRAKAKRLVFELDREWAETQSDKCAVTGAAFKISGVGGPLVPSFDRIDPKKGYTKTNTRLVCQWYNIAKQDWDDSEIKGLIIAAAANMNAV